MKPILTLIILYLFVLSCGDKEQSVEDILATKDIKTIQAKKSELVTQQQQLATTIKQIDDTLKILSPDKNIPLVTKYITKTENFTHYTEVQGSVATKQNVIITPEISGILLKVYVKEGDQVKKGQTLAKIDDGGLSQQRAQLQIQTNLAKTTYERQKRLWDQNIGSEIQFLNAKSNYESLQESVNQIDKQLSKTTIRAPFSGIIDNVITEQGNVVSTGMSQIFRIVNLSNMYITADIPESYITSITKGNKVEVYFPVLGKTIETTLRQTGTYINPTNRTFNVEIEIPKSDKLIKPNLTARLKINDYNNENAILIPQSILSENAKGEQYVYVLTEKEQNKAKAKQTIIKTGKTIGNNIEVVDGLNPEEELVLEGARSVKDGQTVKIIQ